MLIKYSVQTRKHFAVYETKNIYTHTLEIYCQNKKTTISVKTAVQKNWESWRRAKFCSLKVNIQKSDSDALNTPDLPSSAMMLTAEEDDLDFKQDSILQKATFK